MASIYNQQVPQSQRAKILYLSSEQTSSDIPAIAKSTDALLLLMGGMDGANATLYEESGFKARVDQAAAAGIPVLAQFNLSARFYLDAQMSLDPVLNLQNQYNKALIKIIDILRTQPWTFDILDAKSGWRPVHALVLNLYAYQTNGADVTDVWQQATLQSVLYPLQALMSQGKMPKLPIIVSSYPAFLARYNNQLLNFLYNRRGEISIGLHQWIYDAVPGPQLTSLQVLWDTYRPADTFKFQSLPYGYQGELGDGHVVFHVFTADRFSVPEAVMRDGSHARVTCALWCDTKEALYLFLNFNRVIVPPDPGDPGDPGDGGCPVYDAELEGRILTLEDKVAAMTETFNSLSVVVNNTAIALQNYKPLR
jgi:hypothetical protein